MENIQSQQNVVNMYELIAYVETCNNCKALRFEPATYAKLSITRSDSQKLLIEKIQTANKCSWGTALMIYSSSFGATQIMGFNLYGPMINYQKSIIDFCETDVDQKNVFAHFLICAGLANINVRMLELSVAARHKFAIIYNGSPAYADEIVSAIIHFKSSKV